MLRILRYLLPLLPLLATPAAASAGPIPPGGKVFLKMDEALALAFPECEIVRERHFLSKAELVRAKKLAKGEVPSAIVRPYVASKKGKVVGTAYFDTHRVRSLRETLMIVVDLDGRVRRTEVLAFAEPLDYLPRAGWYGQFLKRALDDELSMKRSIRGVAGATLTAQATTEAVRRVLALHNVLEERSGPPAAVSVAGSAQESPGSARASHR